MSLEPWQSGLILIVLVVVGIFLMCAIARVEEESCGTPDVFDLLCRYSKALDALSALRLGAGRMVYISGPMTGKPYLNFAAFDEAERALLLSGYDVHNPVEINRQHPDMPYEWYMERDLKAVRDSQAVLALAGWTESRGAKREIALALSRGLPVICAESGAVIGGTMESRRQIINGVCEELEGCQECAGGC